MTDRRTAPRCSCAWTGTSARVAEVRRLLRLSAAYTDSTPGRGGISGQTHALRCAALAAQHARHPDAPFIALIHDLGRPLNDVHHGEVIAEIVRDRVTPLAYTVLRTHGAYQAAVVHGTAPPQLRFDIHRVALQLSGYEVRSFAAHYDGPEMSLADADALIEGYLGDDPV